MKPGGTATRLRGVIARARQRPWRSSDVPGLLRPSGRRPRAGRWAPRNAGWTAPEGIDGPDWGLFSRPARGPSDEDLPDRFGYRQVGVSGACGGHGGPRGEAASASARAGGEVCHGAAIEPGGAGGLRVGPMGAAAAGAGARGAADPGGLREAVRAAQQDRCAGRSGDLHGAEAAGHVVRSDQERRAAGRAGPGAVARAPGQAAHPAAQQWARPARRAWPGRGPGPARLGAAMLKTRSAQPIGASGHRPQKTGRIHDRSTPCADPAKSPRQKGAVHP
jgi:hypothetical protein